MPTFDLISTWDTLCMCSSHNADSYQTSDSLIDIAIATVQSCDEC